MHDEHIYHEDIKDSNIMIAKGTNDPIYVDFGLGCKANLPSKGPYSCDRALGGSEFYMSKSKLACASAKKCNEEELRYADIWALGMVLLATLSGVEPPTDEETVDDDDLRYQWFDNYLQENSNKLYVKDKNINNVIKLALSNNINVTVDDLIKAFKN